MKRILYLFLVLSIVACNNKKPETAEAYPTTPNGLQGIQQPGTTNSSVQTGNTGIVNPPHGQPGHNCDIAVGAKLPTTTQATPKADTTIKSPVIKDKNLRLNPAHGQPGHKCDIAVGAPLT